MRFLAVILALALFACNEKPELTEDNSSEPKAAYTKTMVYAVDLNSVFHEDLNDEDFSDVAPISKHLMTDVLEGKLKAFDPISEELISAEQVKSMLIFTDTVWYNNPETGDQSIEIVERDYTQDFYGVTFKEQWIYNQENSVIEKKTVGLAPRIPVYSKVGGELRGYTSAFWVHYN